MATDDPGQEDRVARLRQPQATSNNAQNRLAKFAKTDFGHLRASLKLRDAAIGVVVVGVVFCLGHLDFNRYQFQPFLNWMIWLLLLSLPSVCMISLPLWLSRKRRANLVHWPGIRSILVEAAIAAPLALVIILFDNLLGIDDSEIRRAWEWVILRPDLRMVFVMIVPFMVVIGPVAEELFYRAFLYNALRSRLPAVIAATAQAALFAIPHFYGLAWTTVLFGHGLCLIGIYLWRKTLLTPIFVHVFRNLIFVVWLLAAAVAYTNTAQLGVLLGPHEGGCLIVEVMPGSAADRAGLQVDDIIMRTDDQPVESPEELTSLIQGHEVGDRMAIAIIRDGNRLEFEAVLGQRNTSHYTILDHGRDTIPEIAEFKRLFPNFEHVFYSGKPECQGDERQEFTAGIHGRYVLQMNIDITFSPSGAIASHSEPQFLLLEASSVSHSWGSTSVRYSDNQRRFGMADWKKVVNSGGDLSVLGLNIEKDRSVPGFNKVFPNNR